MLYPTLSNAVARSIYCESPTFFRYIAKAAQVLILANDASDVSEVDLSY